MDIFCTHLNYKLNWSISFRFNCACVVKPLAGQTEQTWHSLACAVTTEGKTVRVWGPLGFYYWQRCLNVFPCNILWCCVSYGFLTPRPGKTTFWKFKLIWTVYTNSVPCRKQWIFIRKTYQNMLQREITDSNVYWTVHHCNSWAMKNQLDVTCYFISLIMRSTCFGH